MTSPTPIREERLSGVRFDGKDFSGRDLRKMSLKGSVFHNCNFDGVDLSHVDCEGSDFSGSTFRRTICYYTNFRNARLANTVFEPADAYGVTFTMHCKTFENMKISPLYWYAWLMFATQMWPQQKPGEDNIKDLLIGMIGATRYQKLRDLFSRRDL